VICYLDTTFCTSPNCKNDCGRQLTPEIVAQAEAWWGGDDPPIALAYFCGEPELGETIDKAEKESRSDKHSE